jgi:hypothetical protein
VVPGLGALLGADEGGIEFPRVLSPERAVVIVAAGISC